MGKKEILEKMITVKADLLSLDCKRYAKFHDTSYTKLMVVNDMASGAIAASKERYLKSCGKMEIVIDTHCEYGLINQDLFEKICKVFELNKEDYLVVVEKEQCEIKTDDCEQEEKEEQLPDAIQQLILGQNTYLQSLTEAIVNIGKIQAQTMKYVEEIKSMLNDLISE